MIILYITSVWIFNQLLVDLDFSKPALFRVLKHLYFPSIPLSRGRGRRRFVGQEGFQFCGQDISSPVQKIQTWISSSSSTQKTPLNWHESTEVARSSQNTKRMTSKNEKTVKHYKVYQCMNILSKDQQRDARQTNARAASHCLWGYIYILYKYHASFHVSSSAEHPSTCVWFDAKITSRVSFP